MWCWTICIKLMCTWVLRMPKYYESKVDKDSFQDCIKSANNLVNLKEIFSYFCASTLWVLEHYNMYILKHQGLRYLGSLFCPSTYCRSMAPKWDTKWLRLSYSNNNQIFVPKNQYSLSQLQHFGARKYVESVSHGIDQ